MGTAPRSQLVFPFGYVPRLGLTRDLSGHPEGGVRTTACLSGQTKLHLALFVLHIKMGRNAESPVDCKFGSTAHHESAHCCSPRAHSQAD
jgi:hypothetical protein